MPDCNDKPAPRLSPLFDDNNEKCRTWSLFPDRWSKDPLASNWLLEPSAFIKSSDMLFKAIQLDITSRVYYRNDYWLGLSWRTQMPL